MKNILVSAPVRACDREKLQATGLPILFDTEPDETLLSSVEVIIGAPRMKLPQQSEHLRWVHTVSAGADAVVSRLPQGVILTCGTGAYGKPMAEYVLAMVLSLQKFLPQYRDQQRAEMWHDYGAEQSIEGRNVLVLGTGNIGCAIAEMFRRFSCRTVGVRRRVGEVPTEFDTVCGMDSLREQLSRADIIVCALPRTKETAQIIDESALACMKRTAILVNVGRGNAVDCEALAEALAAHRIFGAALDVTEPEPLPVGHPLWQCGNFILTPHITGSTFGHLPQTTDEVFDLVRENLARYAAGRSLLNVVDLKAGYKR